MRKSRSLKAFPSFHFTSSHDYSFSDSSVRFALLYLPAETGVHRSAGSDPEGLTVSSVLRRENVENVPGELFLKVREKFAEIRVIYPFLSPNPKENEICTCQHQKHELQK